MKIVIIFFRFEENNNRLKVIGEGAELELFS